MRLDAISPGENPPEDVNVVIEVPLGGEPIKYEMHKESGTVFVDRFLYTPMRYPGNYGFIPHTLAEDGDPVDVLVCNRRALIPGCFIRCRPVGVLVMEDQAGMDEKIIALPVPALTRMYDKVESYTDLPAMLLAQIKHFFEHYKDLEDDDKWVRIVGWEGAEAAKRLIAEGIAREASNGSASNG